jgi:hypothetical protein
VELSPLVVVFRLCVLYRALMVVGMDRSFEMIVIGSENGNS